MLSVLTLSVPVYLVLASWKNAIEIRQKILTNLPMNCWHHRQTLKWVGKEVKCLFAYDCVLLSTGQAGIKVVPICLEWAPEVPTTIHRATAQPGSPLRGPPTIPCPPQVRQLPMTSPVFWFTGSIQCNKAQIYCNVSVSFYGNFNQLWLVWYTIWLCDIVSLACLYSFT